MAFLNRLSTTFSATPLTTSFTHRDRLEALVLVAILALCTLSLLVLSLPPWILMLAIACLAGIYLAFLYPFASFLVLLFAFFLPADLGDFTLAQPLGSVVVAVGLTSHIYRRRSLRAGPFMLPLLSLGAVIVLSAFYARSAAPLSYVVYRLIVNLIIYVLLLAYVDDSRKLRHVLTALLLAGLVNAVAAIYSSYMPGHSIERATAFLSNANHLGFLCAFLFPIAFSRSLNSRYWRSQLAYLFASGLLLTGVMVTASRGATLSLIAAIGVCSFFALRRPIHLFALLAIIVVSLAFAPDLFFTRVSNLKHDVTYSVRLDETHRLTSRGYLHRSGLKVWHDYPLLGVGTGNFGKYYITATYNPGWKRTREIPQHSLYLRILVENGLLGAAFLCWIFWRLGQQLKYLLTLPWTQLPSEVCASSQAIIAAAVVLIIMAFGMDFFDTHELYILFALTYLAVATSCNQLAPSAKNQHAFSS